MLSKGTPSIATSPSIISGSKTYGALQNVDMPVCGSAAAWRVIVIESPRFDEVGLHSLHGLSRLDTDTFITRETPLDWSFLASHEQMLLKNEPRPSSASFSPIRNKQCFEYRYLIEH